MLSKKKKKKGTKHPQSVGVTIVYRQLKGYMDESKMDIHAAKLPVS